MFFGALPLRYEGFVLCLGSWTGKFFGCTPKNLLMWALLFFPFYFAVALMGFELAPCGLPICQTPRLPTEPWARSLRTAWNIMHRNGYNKMMILG